MRRAHHPSLDQDGPARADPVGWGAGLRDARFQGPERRKSRARSAARYLYVTMLIAINRGPIFHGDRFADGGLPLDCAGELSAYQRLLKVAATEWVRREDPNADGRKIIATKNAAVVTLVGVEQKCFHPRLAIGRSGDARLVPLAPVQLWADQADAAIEAAAKGQLDHLSEPVLRALTAVGRSLRKGDWININGKETSEGGFTRATRNHVQSYLKRQLKPGRRTLVGIVVGAKDHSSIRRVELVTLDGQQVAGPTFSAADHRQAIAAYTFEKHARPLVRVVVTAMFMGTTAMKVERIEHIEHVAGPELVQRLASIQSLQAGWDGEGAPPIPPQRIETARQFLATCLTTGIARTPTAAPGPNEQLVLEWSLQENPRRGIGVVFDDQPGFILYQIGVHLQAQRLHTAAELVARWPTDLTS